MLREGRTAGGAGAGLGSRSDRPAIFPSLCPSCSMEEGRASSWLLTTDLLSLLFPKNFEVEADDLVTISELGRGAYGVVEKVRHAQSGTIMAVKVTGSRPAREHWAQHTWEAA